MVPPPSKKQKTDATVTPPSPVVFQSSGLPPDTRLTLFGKEFHVHSIVLKMHSAYFRKFLDSPEKPSPAVAGQFKYDYVSVVDNDGEWGLEPVSMARTEDISDVLEFPFNIYDEKMAFKKLLMSMYNLPYQIDSYWQLSNMTRLADFYCALPILSSSLFRTIWTSKQMTSDIWRSPDLYLILAKKLRNSVLFREAFIHAVGRGLTTYKDKDLSRLTKDGHYAFCRLKLKADHEILHMIDPDKRISVQEIEEEAPEEEFSGSIYYQPVLEKLRTFDDDYTREGILPTFEALLVNNLVLHKKARAGYGTFFCTEIRDEDMPWDPTEIDWWGLM